MGDIALVKESRGSDQSRREDHREVARPVRRAVEVQEHSRQRGPPTGDRGPCGHFVPVAHQHRAAEEQERQPDHFEPGVGALVRSRRRTATQRMDRDRAEQRVRDPRPDRRVPADGADHDREG